MDKAKKVLDTFCLAFWSTLIGTNLAQFGLQKWEGIGIGGRMQIYKDLELKWATEGEGTKYLGCILDSA